MTNPVLAAMALLSAATLPAATLQAAELPLRANDLASGERYSTRVHTLGIQAEGKDIGVRRFKAANSWSHLKTDGADAKVLDNWLVYGKPFYAMAAGKVIGCWRNAPQNTPGSYHADYEKKLIPGGGNMLWILHDDGSRALYAHAQTGSIPASLCPHNQAVYSAPNNSSESVVTDGARVKAGQLLGRIGNAGASKGGPHLHVHMEKAGKAHPMTFARGLTTPYDAKATLDGPWTPLAGKALPKADILFWPPHGVGNYKWIGTRDEDYQRLVEHMADSGMMPSLVSCADNGASYTSQWVPAQGKWASHHGMTAKVAAEKQALYTGQGYQRTSSFTCGARQVAVWRK